MDEQTNILKKSKEYTPAINIYNKVSGIKVLILGIFLVVTSFWFGFQFHLLSYFSSGFDAIKLTWFGFSLILFLLLFVLNIVLIPKTKILFSVLFFASVLFAVGFMGSNKYSIILLVWLIMFLGMVWAGYETKKFIEHSLKIKFVTISNLALRKIMLSISIIAAIIFYGAFYATDFNKNNPIFPESVFDISLSKVARFMKPVFGDLDFSMTLREISEKNIDKITAEQGIFLTIEQKNLLVKKTILDYQNKINKIFGQTFNPDKNLSSAIYDSILYKFNNLKKQTRNLVLFIMAAMLMLSIQALSPVIRIILVALSFVFYEMLKIFGFFIIVYEQKSKESIVLA